MSRRVDLKGRMRAGERVFGGFVNAASPVMAEVMALAGYDCLMIDREHGPADIFNATLQVTAIRTTGCAALMRVPANDPVELKRALDIGLDGVMIPAIDTADQARAAVAGCRYPPKGTRGLAAGVVRASGYGTDLARYMETAEREFLIMGQIETATGLENVETIAAVEGVDMLFVGPYDLSANLGYLGAPDHPDVDKAIERVKAAARDNGKLLGIIPTPGRGVADLFARGFHMVLGTADIILLREAAKAEVATARAVLGAGSAGKA
jgi:4-hydroxy-2-oxoheptanedioate aldolase